MKVIGITGMMGSGKSSVGRILAGHDYPVLECDQIVARLYETAEIKDILQSRFGLDAFLPDGSVDKARLASYAFAHPQGLSWLESILWPRVRERVQLAIFGHAKNREALLFVIGSHLFAGGLADSCQEIWLLTASEEAMIERVQAAKHWTRRKAELCVAASRDEMIDESRATLVITNDADLPALRAQVEIALANA